MALREGSLVSQIATLDVGESFSRTTMVPFKARGVREDIAEAKRRLRNHLNKHQERATKVSRRYVLPDALVARSWCLFR